nr:MAG TPA: hypothetical protein [Caudoviricetes sp.]
MNNLQTFNFNNQPVRTIQLNNQPYFNLKDVCEVLDIKNHKDVVSRLNPKGVDTTDTLTNGGMQKMTYINESNLYKTIFQSRKEEAEQFTEWVTSEVLPAIRKNGAYLTDEKAYDITHNPQSLADLLLQAGEQLKQKEIIIQEMKPKADYFDNLVERNLLTNFRDTAKELGLRQTDLINNLIEDGYVYRDQKSKLKPYAKYGKTGKGLFELKEFSKNDHSDVQTLITPKGRETFRLLYTA